MSDPLQNQASQGTPTPGAVTGNADASFPSDSPTAQPSDFFPPVVPLASSSKTGSGKIIATFLGMLLLVGGLGVGIVLVEQPQLINQQAAVQTGYTTVPVTFKTGTTTVTRPTGKVCIGKPELNAGSSLVAITISQDVKNSKTPSTNGADSNGCVDKQPFVNTCGDHWYCDKDKGVVLATITLNEGNGKACTYPITGIGNGTGTYTISSLGVCVGSPL